MKLSDFRGKTILVMGLGLHGGGVGAAAFFARLGSWVVVTDLKTRKELAPSLEKLRRFQNITCHLGGHRPMDFKTADYVIKNPGVPQESKYLRIAKKSGIPVLTDVGIFFSVVRRPIIGVTGTKGKSTTAALIALLLGARYPRVLLAGNIRKSVLEIIGPAKRADYIVLELSSFQLEDLGAMARSPHVAVLTSFSPDHLNRHGTIENYRRIKCLITAFQTRDDVVVIPRGRGLESLLRHSKAKKIRVSVREASRSRIAALNPYLTAHLADAALLALAVARHLKVPEKGALKKLRRFRALEGRLERVRVFRGLTFINDTTATAPAAAAAGLALIARERPVVLIAGGADKRLPFRVFSRAIARHAKFTVFLPGSATEKIIAGLAPAARRRTAVARSMREAVDLACRVAKRGDAILLSPGAASFGLFTHEFDRGEQFIRAVKRLG